MSHRMVMRHTTQSTRPLRQSLVTVIEHMSDEQRLAYLTQHFAQYRRLSPREVRAFRRGIVWRQRIGSRLPSPAALACGVAFGLWVASVLYGLCVRW